MASAPSANLGEARKLAQSCWARCKNSPSSYKLLTASVRKLRNTLEEVEEIYDDFRTLGPDDLKLLNNVLKASETLQQLDQALQNHRSSSDIRESDVADLKTSLDVIAHELTLAFENVTTGEIPLQLDTSVTASLPARDPSTSSYTGDSALGRKSSQASSAWSSVQKDSPSLTDTGSEFEDAKVEPKSRISTEKEVRTFRKPSFQSLSPTSSSATSEARIPSLDWRSPFASPDPLSISIEEASSLILTPTEEEGEFHSNAVRSRSGTGSTVFAPPPTQPPEDTISTPAPKETLQNADQTPPQVDLQSEVTTSPPDSPSLARFQGETLPLAPSSPRAETSLSIDVPPATLPDTTYLSPASAATPAARKARADSLSSKPSVESLRTESKSETVLEEQDLVENSSLPTDSTAREPKDGVAPVSSPESELNAIVESPRVEKADIAPEIPPRASTPPTETDAPLSPPKSPPVPNRRPPPPPPSPRRNKVLKVNKRVSSYRVVNAEPIDDESSDDDELYRVSRPSSMVKSTAPVLPTIPQVSIADHDHEVSSTTAQVSESDALDLFQQPIESRLVAESSTATPVPVSATVTDSAVFPPFPPTATEEHSNRDTSTEDENPPPLPERPLWSRKTSDRPHIATMVSSVTNRIQKRTASMAIQKEAASEPRLAASTVIDRKEGLGIKDIGSFLGTSNFMQERRSTDDGSSKLTSQASSSRTTAKPSTPDVRERAASTSQIPHSPASPVIPTVTEWYGPGSNRTELTELERERINHITHFWNDAAYDQAEAYLSDYLSTLLEQNSPARARRVYHLLGVSASLRGDWERAIPLLLSAMRRPIHDISDLDDGDCAAAYWLGDIYTLSNKRTEALLCYCIAERSSFFHSEDQPGVSTLIALEQEVVQLGASKTELKLYWAQRSTNNPSADQPRSIMDTNVLTTAAAKMLLENEPRRFNRTTNDGSAFRDGKPFHLDGNIFRSNAFYILTSQAQIGFYHRLKIYPSHFEPHTPWPLQYDPTFCIANVQRGRLLPYECDLISVFSTNDAAKIPKSTSKSITQVNCFTSPDLFWLVRTIRECLRTYEMQWSEVANVEGTWFLVRYSFMLNKVATTYYFSIALFKQTLRAGYGVEVCADGIGSSRIVRTTFEYEKGVHGAEAKRVRKLVREYLDEAARQKPKVGKKVGGEVMGLEMPPPIPPRPKTAGKGTWA